MNDENEIFGAIKKARQERKLSQRELSARIGVPQSHISRIESGQVDLQLSSLTQIARALDLEVKLVPKRALPAVNSVVRGFPRDRTGPALQEISRAQRTLERIVPGHQLAELSTPFEQLSKSLKGLQALNYDTDAFVRLRDALAPIGNLGKELEKLNLGSQLNFPDVFSNSDLSAFEKISKDLRILRNNLAHRHELDDVTNRPAYSLEEDDDE